MAKLLNQSQKIVLKLKFVQARFCNQQARQVSFTVQLRKCYESLGNVWCVGGINHRLCGSWLTFVPLYQRPPYLRAHICMWEITRAQLNFFQSMLSVAMKRCKLNIDSFDRTEELSDFTSMLGCAIHSLARRCHSSRNVPLPGSREKQ